MRLDFDPAQSAAARPRRLVLRSSADQISAVITATPPAIVLGLGQVSIQLQAQAEPEYVTQAEADEDFINATP